MTQKNQSQQNQNDDRMDTVRHYVSDMLATEKHIREAVEGQVQDESVKQQPQASQLIQRMHTTLQQHVDQLERQSEQLGGGSSGLKEAVTSTLGTVAGLYDKVRTKQVSRMLRDDYTALSMAAISYTMLHTTALALNERSTADLALRNLKDITPLITEISQVIPPVVATELREDHPGLSATSGQEATRNTQEAWDAKVTRQRMPV